MGKYDPLNGHLRRQRSAEFELSFADMERIIGAMLPRSAEHPEWWADVSEAQEASIQQKAWREAGFDASLVAGKDRVRFKRRLYP
jgi:hypothetical protein